MNIAITFLSATSYGGITYLKCLMPALAELDKKNQYHIFISKDNIAKCPVYQNNFHFHFCLKDNKSPFKRLFWEQFILPSKLKKYKIDVLFTAKNANVLLAQCKTIISIRNMQPLCYKNYENSLHLKLSSELRAMLTKVSIRKADRIIAVSKAVKHHLENNFTIAKTKIDEVYNGNPIVGYFCSRSQNKKSGFLLTASKFVSYANQLNLIKGYDIALRRNSNLPILYIAGGILDKTYYAKVKKFIAENKHSEKIILLGLMPHEKMIEFYRKADAFIYPSTLEACPHTLIEAMACEIPIAASYSPPMPEICDNAAIYFNPYDIYDIAEKIDLITTNQELRQRLKNRALQRCQFFDWNKTAAQLIKVFEKVG